MLINRILSVAAGLVLSTTFVHSGYAGGIQRVLPSKAKTYDITFDGFCDGMTLTISQKVDVVGPSTGCYSGVNEGFTATRGGIKFLDVSSNNNGGGEALTYVFDDPRGSQRGWCNYETSDGVTQNVINCGTYTIGAPGPRGPNRSGDPAK